MDVENRIRRIPLREDSLLFGESQVLPALANGCEEGAGIELAALGRQSMGNHWLAILSLNSDFSHENGESPHVSYLQYGGYSFGFVDPWPSNWLYTQNVYVIEINGVYYLCNASFPGVNLVLSFTL